MNDDERRYEIVVDGRPLPAAPGQSVAAALLAGGIRSWRRTRGGKSRGLFCGIGVCFDCLVTVNGRRSVRACLAEALPGDIVTTDLAETTAAETTAAGTTGAKTPEVADGRD